MPLSLLLIFLATPMLIAQAIDELQRAEDWEIQLSRARQLTKSQQFAEAAPLYQLLTTAAERFQFPLPLRAKAHNNYGSMLHAAARYAAAEAEYKLAIALWTRANGPASAEHAITLNNLGEVYRRLGRPAAAEESYRASLAMHEAVSTPDRLHYAAALNNLATVLAPGPEPLVALEKSLRIKRESLDSRHPDIATTLNNLGSLHQNAGRPTEAENCYREALAIREAQSPPDRPALASVLNNLAVLHRKTGRLPSSEAFQRRAIQLWADSLGPDHPTLAAGLNNLGELLLSQSQYAEAEPFLRRAVSIFESALGPAHPQTESGLANLAALFLRQDKGPGAERLFRRVLDLRVKRLGSAATATIDALHLLAQSLQIQKRYTEAERLLAEELTLLESANRLRTPQHGAALLDLTIIHFHQGRFLDGERCLHTLGEFASALPAGQRQLVGQLYIAYAGILRKAKRPSEASAFDGKARHLLAL
jgi:tetratricopeptide (TPR) repeat protein